jgi:flagellar biogenesis protein FliO
MGRLGGRWIGIGIAVLVVGALALYASGSGARARTAPTTGAYSPGAPSGTETVKTAPTMSAGSMLGLLAKVGIVAVLLGGSLWLLRRYAGTGTRSGGRTGAVSIADTIALAQGRALYVLDIGDRALVVGATPQQFSLLAEVTDPGTLEKLRTAPERPLSPVNDLSQRLSAALQSFTSRQGTGERGQGTGDRGQGTARAGGWSDPTDGAGLAPPQQSPSPAAQSFAQTLATQGAARRTAPPAFAGEPDTADTTARLRDLAARLREARRSA